MNEERVDGFSDAGEQGQTQGEPHQQIPGPPDSGSSSRQEPLSADDTVKLRQENEQDGSEMEDGGQPIAENEADTFGGDNMRVDNGANGDTVDSPTYGTGGGVDGVGAAFGEDRPRGASPTAGGASAGANSQGIGQSTTDFDEDDAGIDEGEQRRAG